MTDSTELDIDEDIGRANSTPLEAVWLKWFLGCRSSVSFDRKHFFLAFKLQELFTI